MPDIKILVVEDEKITAIVLETLLKAWDYAPISASNGKDAMELFGNEKFDMAIVDIGLGQERDGIMLVQQLKSIRDIPVIYITGNEDIADIDRAIATSPSAYIFKPIEQRSLQINIELALHNFHQTVDSLFDENIEKNNNKVFLKNGDFIFLKQSYHFVKLSIQDIIYFETENNYTKIFTEKQKFLIRLGLTAIMDQLKVPYIVRINRAQAINIRQMISFNEIEVLVAGKRELPITKNYKNQFMARFESI